ncbi:winged helix-turn-helix domain-containing protein [Bacillus atrophaeus]|uniref:winged helix-turn-helix domain-containing protein n=1 Tax=Bacillus atrophaeus TaxID=1452 RepID=UPI002E25171D|nr:winged helix-turn-helix domain-containing protein [Bacillus atrophaeus]
MKANQNRSYKKGMLPAFSDFQMELLKTLYRRNGSFINDVYHEVAERLSLTPEQRAILVNSKAEKRYKCYIRAVRLYLTKKQLVDGEKLQIQGKEKIKWRITKSGIDYMKQINKS